MPDPSDHDALAATEQRVDALEGEEAQLEIRVRALEAAVAALRQQIKIAAHELRDDHTFMQPLGAKLVDHGTEHLLSKAGVALIKWLGIICIGIVLFLAGRWGLIK
jgi:hypothetical protein